MTQLDQMIALLEAMGPLDAYEIAEEMAICRQNVDTIIRKARKRGKPRRVYIAKYLVAPEVPKRTKLWMAGNKPDAPRPVYRRRDAARRHDEKRRGDRQLIAKLKAQAGNPFAVAMNQVIREAA